MTTDRERWRRVNAVLDRVFAAPSDERDAVLADACGGDAELRREAEELLAAAAAPAFFDTDAASFAAPALAEDEAEKEGLPAERLGSYRLVREIGAGGMSRVFLAEREGGEFEQRVAIKILRAVGFDLAEGANRFRAERQILASLDHPSIARVFDGGTTEAGLPYLVMELIEGVPLTRHGRDLPLDERLDLAIEACEAVQYAHQRLIVHRDLKPSNILVTPEGQLKLLDFGIAKLLDPRTLGLDGAAPVTRTGLLLMTPEYAAPEQIRGEEVTTATDVYALGVLLYELLTGRRPFDLAGKSASQIESAVCHREPARPSTVAASAGRDRTRRLRRRLEGDLDTILLEALRKEPGERYDSARALADDLRRFRQGLPIAARPATVGYQVRKFVGRNRWGVATGVAAFLALAVFGATMAWQQTVTRRERDRARSAEEQTAVINEFLVEEMLGAAAPEVAQGRDVGVLAAAAQRIEGAFPDQPELEAPVRRTIGELYLSLGNLEEAGKHLTRAHELFAGSLGPEHPDTLIAARFVAEFALARGSYDEAARQAAAIAADQRRILGPDDPEVLMTEGVLARTELEQGDYRAAEERLRSLLDSTSSGEVFSEPRIELEAILTEVYDRQRRYDEVEDTARRVLELQRRRLGPNHPAVARTLTTLGNAQTRNKRFDEGHASLTEALELRERVLGEDHPETLESLRALLIHHSRRDDHQTAMGYARENAKRSHRLYGPDHPRAIQADANVGVVYDRQGRFDLAVPVFRETTRRYEAVLGLAHPSTNRGYRNLTSALLDLGRVDEARASARKVLESGRARLAAGDEDPTFLSDFAWHLVTIRPEELRSPEEALPLVERAVELTRREWPDAIGTLARVHFELGHVDRAVELQREVLAFPGSVVGRDHERNLIEFLEAKGDLEQVEVEVRANLERRRASRSEDEPIFGYSYRNLGLNLQKRGLLERAEVELRNAADHFDRTLPEDSFDRIRAHSELGEVLTLLGRYGEAETELVPAAEGLRGRTGYRDTTSRTRSQGRVAELYRVWGKPELAAEWEGRARAGDRPPAP